MFESVCEDTKKRKQDRYEDLLGEQYRTNLLHLVGPIGFIFEETNTSIARICKPRKVEMSKLLHGGLHKVCCVVLLVCVLKYGNG